MNSLQLALLGDLRRESDALLDLLHVVRNTPRVPEPVITHVQMAYQDLLRARYAIQEETTDAGL